MKEIQYTTISIIPGVLKKMIFRMSNHFFLLQYSPMLDEKNNDGLVVDQSNTILKVVDIFLERNCLVQRDNNLRTFAMVSILDLILYFEFNVLLRAGR